MSHQRWLHIRSALYEQLEPGVSGRLGLSLSNKLVAVLILAASFTAVLETEATLREQAGNLFLYAEIFFVSFFIVEYIARVFAAGQDPRYRGIGGRIRYMFTWWALLDLIAIAPSLITMGTDNAFLLRLFKLLRLARLSRLGRFSRAWTALGQSLISRRYELLVSLALASLLLVFSSALLYLVEAEAQPEAFGSIPRALWWSVATLTTVGYGDVAPITALGRIFAAITAVAGIGMIAMPTGILAAAFSDILQKGTRES